MSAGDTLLTLGRIGGGLLVVIALVLISGRLAKRLRGQHGTSGLRVVDRIVLSKDAHLAVVDTGGRRLLLGVTAQQVSVIGPLDQIVADEATVPDEPEAPEPIAEPAKPDVISDDISDDTWDHAVDDTTHDAIDDEVDDAVQDEWDEAADGAWDDALDDALAQEPAPATVEPEPVPDQPETVPTTATTRHGRRARRTDAPDYGTPAGVVPASPTIPVQRRSERIAAERAAQSVLERRERAEQEAELAFRATQEQPPAARPPAAQPPPAARPPAVPDQPSAPAPNFGGHPDLASALRAAGRTLPAARTPTPAPPTQGPTEPNPAPAPKKRRNAATTSAAVPAQGQQASGSVLSPATWRQGIEALRELTVRRG